MGNMVDAILFEGECCFHLILHHIYYVTRLSLTFTPTSNLDGLINHLNTYLIFRNHVRLNLRVQHYNAVPILHERPPGRVFSLVEG